MSNTLDLYRSTESDGEILPEMLYEEFFIENVVRIDGKYAIFNEGKRTFLMIALENNTRVLFYRSSSGTSWKRQWGWFAYFWKTHNGYVSKAGSIFELENWYGSPKIRELHQKINATLDYDHSHDLDGTIDEAMSFLKNNHVRFRENLLKIPQAENMDDEEKLIHYQNTWINLIEDTKGIAYVYTQEDLKKLCTTINNQEVIKLAISYDYGITISSKNSNMSEENIRYLIANCEQSLWYLVKNKELVIPLESQKYIFMTILEEQKLDNSWLWSNLMALNILIKRPDFALGNIITEKWLEIIARYFAARKAYNEIQDKDGSAYNQDEEERIMKFPVDQLIKAMTGL